MLHHIRIFLVILPLALAPVHRGLAQSLETIFAFGYESQNPWGEVVEGADGTLYGVSGW